MPRRIVTTAVVVILALAGASFGFRKLAALRGESARVESVPSAPLVRAEKAVVQDYQEVLRGFGRALPLRRAEVVAEVAGVVREISPLLEAGTAILSAAGTDGAAAQPPVLVRLDERDLADMLARTEAEVDVAHAEIARLEANRRSLTERVAVADEELETASRELRRIAGLVPKTLSRSDLDAQRIRVNATQRQQLVIRALIHDNVEALVAARAALNVRTRAVDLARREKERARIRAPYPGRIEQRLVNVGERVRIGDPLFTIVDLSNVEVPIALAARRFDEVRPGAGAVARLPGTQAVLWEGAVSRVAPTINAEDRTFFVYIVIPGKPTENPAPPGAHLEIEVQGRLHPQVIPVPRRAFLGDRIFVAKPDGSGEAVIEVRRPTVTRQLAGTALVKGGLADGEFFLVTNIESVAAGSRVRLLTEETPTDPGGAER